MRNFALVLFSLILAVDTATAQQRVNQGMVTTPWSVMDIPKTNLPVLSGPLSPAMGAQLGLRPARLEHEQAVFNYSRSTRRFMLDLLPKGELVWVDTQGAPRYKQSCGNLLAPLPVKCTACHTFAAGSAHPAVPAKNVSAKKGESGPSTWDRFWKAFRDFPWWILPLLALLGLAGYGLWRLLEGRGNNPAPPPAPTGAPSTYPINFRGRTHNVNTSNIPQATEEELSGIIGAARTPEARERLVNDAATTTTPTPAPLVAAVTPVTPAPAPPAAPAPVAPQPVATVAADSEDFFEVRATDGGVEAELPEGSRLHVRRLPNGRFRIRVSGE
jgi:hypothetical protein